MSCLLFIFSYARLILGGLASYASALMTLGGMCGGIIAMFVKLSPRLLNFILIGTGVGLASFGAIGLPEHAPTSDGSNLWLHFKQFLRVFKPGPFLFFFFP